MSVRVRMTRELEVAGSMTRELGVAGRACFHFGGGVEVEAWIRA